MSATGPARRGSAGDGVGPTVKHVEVTLGGLRQLRDRITRHELYPDDWPLLGVLVSKQIARAEAIQRRMLAKVAASSVAADHAKDPDGSPEQPDGSPEVGASTDSPTSGDSGASDQKEGPADGEADAAGSKKAKGHGRNGASAYRQARHLIHPLALGVIGMLCECGVGRMNPYREKLVVRIIGQPVFAAEVHHCEQAWCRKCGRIVRADAPAHLREGLGGDYIRYDWSACAMLVVMHYFAGAPFKRLESLHRGWGIPMSDSNQWQIATAGDDLLFPLYRALEQHAIQQATSFRIDDTGSMVIALKKLIEDEMAALERLGESTRDIRTGINATGLYWETPQGVVILFYTGRHHAGEIVDKLLRQRLLSSSKVVKITDGASKNFDHQQGDKLVEATCNAHALLKFRDLKDKYPSEYAEAGRVYQKVFDNDDKARADGLGPVERMLYHRQHSLPLMQQLRKWCVEKIEGKLVEPRSLLWEPVTFIVNQWERLTRFCDVPGVPLDTNLVEQALIMPVRYLAGSFNYKTQDGATVGDHFMSLIATARANGVEPVAYLTECLRCHEDLAKRPEHYLPWVYRERMKEGGGPLEIEGRGASETSSYATLRHSSGNEQVAGSPPQIRTCNSRASKGENAVVPSPAGQALKRPFDRRLVQSQNPEPS